MIFVGYHENADISLQDRLSCSITGESNFLSQTDIR